MPDTSAPLDHIMYISLPDGSAREVGDFQIDPDILIPVEIVGNDESWTMQNLSWEMIIAAMLKVIVYDSKNPNVEYYKGFVLAIRPEIAVELSTNGIEQANKQNFDVAEELLAANRALLPDDPDASLNLALVYEEHAKVYDRGNRADLAETYRDRVHLLYGELITRFPDNPRARFNAGNFYLHMQNYERAQTHLNRFLELSDDARKKATVTSILDELATRRSHDELFKEAFDFIRLGKEREGIERIRAFIEAHPDVWNAWFVLGWAYRRLEMYQEGYDAFIKAADLGSNDPDMLNELAICQMELQKFDECESTLKKALREDPENTKIISNLGILALKQGQSDTAGNYFRTVLELDPEDPVAIHYLEHLDS